MSTTKKKKNLSKTEEVILTRRKQNSTDNLFGISFKDNDEQRELIRLMDDNDHPIVFCFGDAGTGKTFTAIAAAMSLVKVQKKYNKIFYIREPIEVGGNSLGYLPGDLDDKYGVYLGGLYDNIEHISTLSGMNVNDMLSWIECEPPQFIRGRSFENSILIVDEAQNMNLDELQAICTRLGKYCKLVFLGSLKQIDNRKMSIGKNDFAIAYDILSNIKDDIVARVDLVISERSAYCKVIDEAFNQYRTMSCDSTRR